MKWTVTSSPHIRGNETTEKIMRDVLIALLPAALAGICVYGFRAMMVMVVSVLAALIGEALWNRLTHQKMMLKNGSAAVTGLLLALTLPASVPYWLVALGSMFAVVVVKGMCGGLGQNIFNPALGARAFLLLLWPVYLTRYLSVAEKLPVFGKIDAVSAATPLHEMQMLKLPEWTLTEMFLGNIGGCIGEVSTLALLIGGIYLIIRRVLRPYIPVAYLGTAAILTLIFSHGENPWLWMLYSLCGGGMMLGALFMATDYTTSPMTPSGQLIYGIGCGVLTIVFRYTGLFPEGVTYAILCMNACVWMIDHKLMPRRFGYKKGEAR